MGYAMRVLTVIIFMFMIVAIAVAAMVGTDATPAPSLNCVEYAGITPPPCPGPVR